MSWFEGLCGTVAAQHPSRQLLLAALLVSAILLTLGALGRGLSRSKLEAERWVIHTFQIKDQLMDLDARMGEIEGDTRGYVLTGDPAFLKTFDQVQVRIASQTAALQRLTADNPRQSDRVDALAQLLTHRIEIARRNVSLRREQGMEAALEFIATGEGRRTMEAIQAAIEELAAAEDDLLQDRLKALQARNGQVAAAFWSLLVLLGASFLAGLYLFQRYLNIQRSTSALREAAQAQALAQLERCVADRTEKLKQASDQLRLVDFSVRNASTGMVWLAEDGCILRANPAYYEMVGLAEAQVVGSSFPFVISRNARAAWPGYWQQLRQRKAMHFEAALDHASGRPVPVVFDLKMMEFDGREYAFGFLRDVSEQKRLEEYHRFFEISPDFMCIAGFDGYFKKLNSTWEKILGFTPEELKARPFLEFIHPDDQAATRDVAGQLSAQTHSLRDFRNRYRAKNGDYRWLQWSAIPVPEHQLIYAVAVDATEARRAEEEKAQLNRSLQERNEELRASMEELEAFTYSVSHDLRAPLRHVDGFSRILEDELSSQLPEEARHYLERIRDGARQMGALVDDLLNLSRIGRKPLDLQLTRLDSLVNDALRELAPAVSGRAIEWRVGDLPFVECDPALMRQVFTNLLSNAAKYSRPRNPALIEVGMLSSESGPVVFVRDNGVGFSMKYADKLFGIFQRLHRQEDFEGTGVGLATVQRIIKRHGGRVWAQAELDRGATFFFTVGGSLGDEIPSFTAGGAHA